MLDVTDLTKTFGRGPVGRVHALDHVDFHAERGEMVTVLGPSGCGKTTLLRCIAGFEEPDGGRIRLDGRDITGSGIRPVPAHERGIGLVPQEGALFPHLTVAQNVGFGLSRLGRRERRRRVAETLDLVGLADLAARHPHELSGGQQQRIALARAIAPGPQVILLDEPFSALDEYLRESLRVEVRRLLEQLGTTSILVTHDQEEALAMGDRVAVMRAGRVVQMGRPRDTYYQPADLELARFLGDAVVLRGEVQGEDAAAVVQCAFGALPVACRNGCRGLCEVLIRPENIRVAPEGAHDAGLVGTVRDQTFYGHDGMLRITVDELSEDVSVRVLGDHPYGVGQQVRLLVDRPVCTYPHADAA